MRFWAASIGLCLGISASAHANPPAEAVGAEHSMASPVKAEAPTVPPAETPTAEKPGDPAPTVAAPPAPPTKESLAALGPEAAYDKGVVAFKATRFENAVAYFEHAHKLDPNETFLFNIARAYQELALTTRSTVHVEQAIYHFRLYIERAPTGDDRKDAETRAKALESLAMRLAREAKPATPPPAVPREEKASKTTKTVTRVSAPVSTGIEVPPMTSATLLAGAVCAGLGGVMGLLTKGAISDFDDARNQPGVLGSNAMADAAGRIETFGTGANVAFIAGGTLVATGLLLWLFEDDDWVSNVSAGAGGVVVRW